VYRFRCWVIEVAYIIYVVYVGWEEQCLFLINEPLLRSSVLYAPV